MTEGDGVHRFTKVLFCPLAAHGNPSAIQRVAAFVAGNDARLCLFGVVAEPSRWQRMLRPDLVEGVLAAERERIAASLRRWASYFPGPAEVEVCTGDVTVRIVERVLTEDHDFVVVTSDDNSSDHATVRRLLRKCPCPIWVVRPTRARTQRVLAAVNPDPEELELNRSILELASDMVERAGGELHVVHAWELYGEATMRASSYGHVSAQELDSLLDEQRARHRADLDRLLDVVAPPPSGWTVHLEKGPAEAAIPALVAKKRMNLLVMGTVARSGIHGAIIGNTAERVLDEVRCSVIAVKPADFVSPLDRTA